MSFRNSCCDTTGYFCWTISNLATSAKPSWGRYDLLQIVALVDYSGSINYAIAIIRLLTTKTTLLLVMAELV